MIYKPQTYEKYFQYSFIFVKNNHIIWGFGGHKKYLGVLGVNKIFWGFGIKKNTFGVLEAVDKYFWVLGIDEIYFIKKNTFGVLEFEKNIEISIVKNTLGFWRSLKILLGFWASQEILWVLEVVLNISSVMRAYFGILGVSIKIFLVLSYASILWGFGGWKNFKIYVGKNTLGFWGVRKFNRIFHKEHINFRLGPLKKIFLKITKQCFFHTLKAYLWYFGVILWP